ncbi:hypothetical protein ACHAPV_009556 [Trichoderma viride]
MSTPNYSSHPNSWAWPSGAQSQLFPTLHPQGLDNEPYASYTDQTSIYGSHGVQGPSWQNGQAIRSGSLDDESDIQEVSRETWQAANNVNTERKAMSRARSMAPSSQQNATQRRGSFTPILPVLEPRIRILIPVCISGRSLMPPPTQAFEVAFQVQEPVLVEGQEVNVREGQ